MYGMIAVAWLNELRGRKSVKHSLAFLLLLVLFVTGASSCRQMQDGVTVRHIALSQDEQRIADLTCDIVGKFLFQESKTYDILIYP